MGLPPGWMLKSVHASGVDITDAGMEFKGGDVAGLEVTLTSKITDVSGRVTGPAGRPVMDYTVVLFADDPQRWLFPATRWVVGTRPNQDGRFRDQGAASRHLLRRGGRLSSAGRVGRPGGAGAPQALGHDRRAGRRGREDARADDQVKRCHRGVPSDPPGRIAGTGVGIFDRSLSPGVDVADPEDHDDQPERQPLADVDAGPAHRVAGTRSSSLSRHPADDDERAVDQRRIAAHQASSWPITSRIATMPRMPPVMMTQRLRRHRDRDQDRVDGEDDVGQLDLDDRRPEGATARATAAPA